MVLPGVSARRQCPFSHGRNRGDIGNQRAECWACSGSHLKPSPHSSWNWPLITVGDLPPTRWSAVERVLRQTVIGMIEGTELGEHNNPGEATVHVLRGRVRLSSGDHSWEGRTGDLLIVPDARHSLHALENSAVLLTVATLA